MIYIDLLTYLPTYLCPFSCVIYIDLLTYLSTYLPMPFLMCGIYRPTYLSIYLPTYALSHVWYIWNSGFFIIIEPTATEFYVPTKQFESPSVRTFPKLAALRPRSKATSRAGCFGNSPHLISFTWHNKNCCSKKKFPFQR